MNENTNYDVIEVTTEAVGSVMVKWLLCVGTLFLGGILGGYTGGDGTFNALGHGLLWTLEIAVTSILTVKGFVILPLIFCSFYCFLRFQLPRWLLIIPIALFWFLSHDYISDVYETYEQEGILHELN